jgi:ATP phosphoribosyltransferase
MRERLRLAIPNKGRLVEPTLALLHDAGLIFDEHDRSLVARVQNFDLDVLFVRTNDVIEFVGDGVATSAYRRRPPRRDRRGAATPPLARLRHVPPRRRRPDRLAIHVGGTARGPARRDGPPQYRPPLLREKGIAVDVISISGAVEVAPRLGLAEAIVDLVSTGSTLVMNGLRPIGDVLESEAVLIANPTAHTQRAADVLAIETMISAVIAARDRKYLMMNARPSGSRTSRRCCRASNRPRSSPSPTLDDRDPRGRRRERGLGPAAAPQVGRRLGDPRPPDREDRPVTATVDRPRRRPSCAARSRGR